MVLDLLEGDGAQLDQLLARFVLPLARRLKLLLAQFRAFGGKLPARAIAKLVEGRERLPGTLMVALAGEPDGLGMQAPGVPREVGLRCPLLREMLAPQRLEFIPDLAVGGLARLTELRLAGGEKRLPLLAVALAEHVLLEPVENRRLGQRVVEGALVLVDELGVRDRACHRSREGSRSRPFVVLVDPWRGRASGPPPARTAAPSAARACAPASR